MIRVRIDPGLTRDLLPIGKLHWELVSRQRLGIWVSLGLPVTIATLGIDMCEGVGERLGVWAWKHFRHDINHSMYE